MPMNSAEGLAELIRIRESLRVMAPHLAEAAKQGKVNADKLATISNDMTTVLAILNGDERRGIPVGLIKQVSTLKAEFDDEVDRRKAIENRFRGAMWVAGGLSGASLIALLNQFLHFLGGS